MSKLLKYVFDEKTDDFYRESKNCVADETNLKISIQDNKKMQIQQFSLRVY